MNSISGFERLSKETVRRDLERRLRVVEMAGSGIEVWIEESDGTVRGPHGKQMTRDEAEALARATGTCMITISETDAQL
jgi:hypothetical protein